MPRHQRTTAARVVTPVVLASAAGLLLMGCELRLDSTDRLVGIEPLPDSTVACVSPARPSGTAAFPDKNAPSSTRASVRAVRDSYPSFASVAVDPKRNQVVFTDENLFQILVYDRRTDTPAGAPASEPQRVLRGPKTEIEFQAGVHVDQATGEIYAINNDTIDKLVVFAADAQGDVAPARELDTPHGTFGMAIDEKAGEVFLTVQHDSALVVYEKTAREDQRPIRLLQGNRTKLADPHGVAIDSEKQLMFVTNFGSTHDVRATEDMREEGPNWPLERGAAIPGTGRFHPPSINVYASRASGNTAPLRVIQGPKTQLNWPTGIVFHPQRKEIFVVNDTDHSVLVFDAAADGDVAPRRVIRGPKTELRNPTGITIDFENQEVWVANFGNHSATVYRVDAAGDVPPLRRIRSAPQGQDALMIGNPGALGFDTKRGELLVPN